MFYIPSYYICREFIISKNIKQLKPINMKRIFTNLFMMALMLVCAQAVSAQSFSGGTGTETDPFKISKAADLKELSTDVSTNMNSFAGSYFIMTQDIDMEGVTDFQPIGNNFSGDVHAFSGHFNGDGHKIYNLKANWEELGFVGVFGIILNATIENLTLASSDIYGDLGVGGLVGVCMTDNTISNCHTTSDVTVGVRKFYIAGICGGALIGGANGSVIKDCTNGARIKGCVGYSAGILGTNGQNNMQMIRCGNYGEISDDQLHVAGIVAHSKNGISIIDCYNTGKISMLALEGADNARGAGILAIADEVPAEELINVINCYNAGEFNEVNEKIHAIYQGDYVSYNNTTVSSCYYANDLISGEFDCTTGMASADMKTQDFVNKLNGERTGEEACWTIIEGVNNGYPVALNEKGVHTAIKAVADNKMNVTYNAGMVTVSGMAAGAKVVVADIAGRIVAEAAADAQGAAVVDMTALNAGAYIVSADGKSIKIAK